MKHDPASPQTTPDLPRLVEQIKRETASPVGYVAWLQVIAAEKGRKPLTERDAEHLAIVAQGIVDQAVEIERLRDALQRILGEQNEPFPTTMDGPMRRDARIKRIAFGALKD